VGKFLSKLKSEEIIEEEEEEGEGEDSDVEQGTPKE